MKSHGSLREEGPKCVPERCHDTIAVAAFLRWRKKTLSQEMQWPLETGNKAQVITIKKMGPQAYICKKMSSDNSSEQYIDYPAKPPESLLF